MASEDLVQFSDVCVLRATAPALLCLIRGRQVWLPRTHVTGKLWRTGDRGKLFIPRRIAQDRELIEEASAPGIPFRATSFQPPMPAARRAR